MQGTNNNNLGCQNHAFFKWVATDYLFDSSELARAA